MSTTKNNVKEKINTQYSINADNLTIEELNALIDVVTVDELNKIKASSVIPLPNEVKDSATALKQRMVNIATDEDRGLAAVINKRVVLMSLIFGKLATTYIMISDVVDNCITENSTKPLSAKQGKVLKDLIDTCAKYTDIVDNLTSDASNKMLSAKQGNVLKALIDGMKNAGIVNSYMANNSIDTAQLVALSVTTAKLADNAVTAQKILNGEVTESKLADNAVTENKIKDNEISKQKLKANSISTGKVENKAITLDKLADEVLLYLGKGVFKGEFESASALPETAVLNDYAYVKQVVDGDPELARYKYNGSEWVFELVIPNTSFTENEWLALQSGITATLVEKLSHIENYAQKNVQADFEESNNTKDSFIKNKPISQTAEQNGTQKSLVTTGEKYAWNNKVDKSSSNYSLYATGNGTQTMIGYGMGASGGKIPQRDGNGQINVPVTPTNDEHATSKKYVNEAVAEAKAEIEENFAEASTDITDTTLYKISGVADTLALPKKSQVEIVKIEGNSYKYVQLMNNTKATFSESGMTFTNNNDGSLTINGTASATVNEINIVSATPFLANHKYFIGGLKAISGIAYGVRGFALQYSKNFIFTYSNDWTQSIAISMNNGTSASNVKIYPQIFDLTAMGIDTTDVSVATAELLKRGIDVNTYNVYDSGSIKDADTTELESCGINIWDGDLTAGDINQTTGEILSSSTRYISDYVPFLPSTTYYGYCEESSNASAIELINFYDKAKNYLGQSSRVEYVNRTTFTTPANAYYGIIRVTNASKDYHFCINYSNASINGNYYPYTHDSVNVGSDVLRSAENVRDSKTADGTINRLITKYTYTGSEEWAFHTNSQFFYMYIDGLKERANYLCSNDIVFAIPVGGQLRVYLADNPQLTSSSDMNTIFPSGTVLYFEKTTPTTEQGTPFSSNALAVEMYGAEWQNGTTPLQVTKNYDISIKDQVLTNVEVDKKQSEQINALDNIVTILKNKPSADNKTYVLKCVNGVLTWVEEQA